MSNLEKFGVEDRVKRPERSQDTEYLCGLSNRHLARELGGQHALWYANRHYNSLFVLYVFWPDVPVYC